jgi:peroxiredoxin family protein
VVRTVIGVDATGSMGFCLKQLRSIIDPIFKEINKAIAGKMINCTIEMKIMAYRNYGNSYEEIIDSTGWEKN